MKTIRIEKEIKIKAFLNDIKRICKEYNLSISHEDNQGAFIIEEYKISNIKWLKEAQTI